MPRPLYKKGQSGNPKGRPKGCKNKFTTLKDAFVNAFQTIGGEDALVEWLKKNNITYKNKKGRVVTVDLSSERKKEFFKMVASMLPKEVAVTGAGGTPLIPAVAPTIIFCENPEELKTTLPKGEDNAKS